MSATTILILTVLVLVLVLAVALLAGSLALLLGRPREDELRGGGLIAALRVLDRQWQVERLIYRHHRLFGVIVLLTGTFCLWQLGRADLIALLDGSSTASALLWILLLGQGFNLVVGLVILLRPSLLKPVESLSNRWHGSDPNGGTRGEDVRSTAVVLSVVGLLVVLVTATLIIHQISDLLG